MNKKNNANSGFTLVEVLVVIIIIGVLLGVGIYAITKLIEKSKTEEVKSQEKLLIVAAKNYLQENRSLLPKSIGETTTVPIDVLRSNNYITVDIVNGKNETCMNNSFVTAYKETSKKYTYKAYLYCGEDSVETGVAATVPIVTIDFVDMTGKSIKDDVNILKKVSEAKYIIDFDGGTHDGKKVAIDGYSYSVSIQKTGEAKPTEVYSSGTLSAAGAYTIHVDRDNNLSDYIDVTTSNKVIIKATVRNAEGGVSEGVEFLGESSQQATAEYKDDDNPICGRIIGQASANDWITRTTSTTERKISVMCSDGSGSGCIRSTFTKTWSGNVEAGTSSIQIKDNAGNVTNCPVLVNIDRKYPVITVDAYAKAKSENTVMGNSVIGGSKSTNTNGVLAIQDTEYANLDSGYMTKRNYPYGVIYKVTLSDLALDSWKWEVNENDITETTNAKYEVVSSSIGEGKTGKCSNQSNCEFYVTLVENGLRKGMLTVTDKRGNQSTFTVYARIDRRAPGAPIIINSSSGKSNGDWTRDNVYLTLSSTLDQSKIGDYYYTYNENANPSNNNGTTDSDANTKWVKLSGGTGQIAFNTTAWTTEMDKRVYVMVCDIFGNCSDSNETDIKIDRTAPKGLVVKGYVKTSSADIDSPSGLDNIASGAWHSGWVLVVPSGATDSPSGEVKYLLTVEGASGNVIDSDADHRNINAEGWSKVTYKACDPAGNCTSAKTFEINLDRTAPTTPEVTKTPGDEWTKSNVVVSIRNSMDSGVGIGEYYYSYASSPSGNGSDPSSSWVEMTEGKNKDSFTRTWTEEISKNVKIKVCDTINNCNTKAKIFIGIDRTAPSTPTIFNADGTAYTAEWRKTSFSLLVVGNDGNGSGLDECQYTYKSNATEVGDDSNTQWKHNNGDFNDNNTEFTTTPFSLERNQNVYLRVCDKVGNCSNKASALIQIDKTKPTCGDVVVTGDNSENGITGTVACSDVEPGECKNDKFTFSNLTATTNVTIKDKANNTTSCPVQVFDYVCFAANTKWIVPTFKQHSNNNCGINVADGNSFAYDTGSCMASEHFHSDICAPKCSEKCNVNTSSCSKWDCCVKRSKKTCYTNVPISSNGTINNAYFGIKTDTNDYDTGRENVIGINNALKYANENGITNIKLVQGNYYVFVGDGDLNKANNITDFYNQNIKLKSDVNFNLNGSSIIAISNSRPKYKVFSVYGESNIKLFNGTIVGDVDSHDYSDETQSNPHDYGRGIAIIGNVNNITIKNMTINKMTGSGIIIESSGSGQQGTNIEISDNQIYSNAKKRAVFIRNDVSNLTIKDNQLGDQIVVDTGLSCYSGLTVDQIKSQNSISITGNTVKSGVTAYVNNSNVNNLFTIAENDAINN